MRAVIQRVTQSGVQVGGEQVARISAGLLVLLGVAGGDSTPQADCLADKIVNLRVFEDRDGKMNRSLLDTGGALLAVSQFTLYGDTAKGHRPSFAAAAPAADAEAHYREFCAAVRALGVRCEEGVFRAHMDVALVNDGPVTLLLEVGAAPEPA